MSVFVETFEALGLKPAAEVSLEIGDTYISAHEVVSLLAQADMWVRLGARDVCLPAHVRSYFEGVHEIVVLHEAPDVSQIMLEASIVNSVFDLFAHSVASSVQSGTPHAVRAPTRTVNVDGDDYIVAPADGLKLTGAVWQVLSRREAKVELASGQTLALTAKNIDDVMQQLAGAAGNTEGA